MGNYPEQNIGPSLSFGGKNDDSALPFNRNGVRVLYTHSTNTAEGLSSYTDLH